MVGRLPQTRTSLFDTSFIQTYVIPPEIGIMELLKPLIVVTVEILIIQPEGRKKKIDVTIILIKA